MMDLIDAHLHLSDVSQTDLQQMHMMGISAVIGPSQLGANKAVSPETIVDIWDYQLEVLTPRAAAYFIKAYSLIGISMVSTPSKDLDRLLSLLPAYLERDDVVGVGEVGFEESSKTNGDRDYQRLLLEEQMTIVKQCGKMIDLHTPLRPDLKLKATYECLDLAAKHCLAFDQVVVDHCTDVTLELVLKSGAWAAISVQPCRGVTPELAARWIMKYGGTRVFVDSDTSPNLSDPLALPKVAYELKRIGADDRLIAQVCCDNARIAYCIH